MSETAVEGNAFLEGLSELESKLARRGPAWLRELREKGRARFEELGFPTTRLEEWKNTNVAPIVRTRFTPAAAKAAVTSIRLPTLAGIDLGGPRLVFANGYPVAELSTQGAKPGGVWIGTLREALEQMPGRLQSHLTRQGENGAAAFEALNSAFLDDGAVVIVPDGEVLDAPIQLIYTSGGAGEPTVTQPRTLILAGESTQVSVVEIFVGLDGGTYFTNAVSETIAGANACVDHYRLQLESEEAYHISTVKSRQGRHSRFTSHNVNLGGKLVRHDLRAVLDGEGGDCVLNGLYLTRGSQHVDNHTLLDHAKPQCGSRELYKGILDDRSRSVFSGRIVVRPQAQKTDAKQSNPNLLLSSAALAHTRPQLEIYADDVKCTHGATVGRIDEDAIFYLRSRALSEAQARQMLIHAFAGEVLERVRIEPLREQLERAIERRLAGGRSEAS